MELKQYFRKIRETEAGLSDTFPLIVSLETSEGGKPGVISEVSREIAAKMIVEGRAALASEEEKHRFREQQAVAKKAADQAELTKQVRVAIISDFDLPKQISDKKIDLPSTTGK